MCNNVTKAIAWKTNWFYFIIKIIQMEWRNACKRYEK